jgi:hypothetical protein
METRQMAITLEKLAMMVADCVTLGEFIKDVAVEHRTFIGKCAKYDPMMAECIDDWKLAVIHLKENGYSVE